MGDRKRNGWPVGRASDTVSFNFQAAVAFVNATVLSDIINCLYVTPRSFVSSEPHFREC